MSPDKMLQKIQTQIKDLEPKLELFLEPTIQPTTSECNELRQQLSAMQDNLVLYHFLRQEKELSPNFTIHAKVSEATMVKVPATNEAPEPSEVKNNAAEIKYTETPPMKTELKEAIVESVTTEATNTARPMSVAINDKFRYINELFSQNSSEYTIAIEQLNTVRSWHDAEIYLSSLKNLYDWDEHEVIVKQFYFAVKKRFT